MKAPLYIIVDVSGSMNEMGKIHLQRNLCRYVAQLQLIDQEKYEDFNILFFKWAQNVAEVVLQNDLDFPVLNAGGSASLSVLSEFFLQNMNNTQRLTIIILTDGNFSNSDILSYQDKFKPFPDLIIRTVAVGADADLLKLKKISTNNTVFLSENISSAIDSTIFGSEEPLAAPVSTAQILQSEPAESEETEEDWDA